MNNNQTIEKLKQMRLSAMAELHAAHLKDNRTGKSTRRRVSGTADRPPMGGPPEQ